MHDILPLTIALIIMAGMLAQWLAWRLKLPSILFLLLLGLLLGPGFGLLNPDDLFGDLLFPVVSLGVALVLFEGALTLKFRDLGGHGASVTNLVTWGAAINWLLIAAGAWFFIHLSWSMALLFGALVVVTGPTVIMPLLRTVRPKPAVGNILRWEGILIDPIGALLAVIVFEAVVAQVNDSPWLFLLQELVVGVLSGAVAAVILGFLLRRHWLPEFLHNVFTLAVVLLVFTLSNYFASESGLLAVTVMGIWLANSPQVDIEDILSFKESLSVLIISVLFILLAARIDFDLILDLGWAALGVLAVIFLARPVMVFLSTLGSELGWREKALLSWIAPRGIVAAAVSALFALRLEDAGYAQASLLPALTFTVIIVTVLLQSFTAGPLARLLRVAEEDDRGVLIVGGNPVAVAIGKMLKEKGFPIRICSANWQEIQDARMAGLDTYFGNPVSSHADRNLDLIGLGRLFAMSRQPDLNTLAAMKYQNEFGKTRVFTLRNAEEKDSSDKSRLVKSLRVPRLFGEDASVQKLSSLLAQGHEIKATRLSEEYDLEAFLERNRDNQTILLFAIDPKGRLRAYTDTFEPAVDEGWTLIHFGPAKERPSKASAEMRECSDGASTVQAEG